MTKPIYLHKFITKYVIPDFPFNALTINNVPGENKINYSI